MLIRNLDPDQDRAALIALQTEAQDYWHLAEGGCNPVEKAAAFFTDCPPNCDPADSHHLGLFQNYAGQPVLSGIAELSFGFPTRQDAYLGLMLLAPRLRGQGAGALLLTEVEQRARAAGSPNLYLAVLDTNPRGRSFWQREGFTPTGLSRRDADSSILLHRLCKSLIKPAG
ncbi:hypothetical protein GCM10010873_34260 [Cypionkella aquatica]|uniref:N-acetyltransferase domain-containing protein n=1 Tax=Cypionkella aquatica TaxID=1756042 RepID=A0AA37X398_9RHOB|nr:GNAT family N-acetyltransferase [Cypionkella aquatica]GLS88055.1 hypothetical protein GCM10010873_30290 [Cypionkella aquatica]GLS88452.1 hypothetical protein GCM10010873_34260 [Cypionkella aquatica]